MYCKEHDTNIATHECSVCGEHFCDLCNNDSNPFICTSCSTKNNEVDALDNSILADDILQDILSSVSIPDKAKVNFDPSDILAQIEAEIASNTDTSSVEIEFNNDSAEASTEIQDEANNETNVDIVEDMVVEEIAVAAANSFDSINTDLDDNTESIEKIVLTKDNSSLDTSTTEIISSDISGDISNNISNVDTPVIEEVDGTHSKEVVVAKTSTFSKLKSKFKETKDMTVEKISSIDMTETKQKATQLSDETKEKANTLSDEAKEKATLISGEAKIKTVAATAYTVEKAKQAKTFASEKMASNKSNLDDTISKIQEANVNGEYDELLSKFNTHYGQGAKEVEDDTQFALPLKINNFLYFLCSLVPGIAQLYLGLSKRGATLLMIASVFLFVTMTPSLFFITAILSFADAYKLRNIYYRGGLIEDTNKDIISFLTNNYVIVVIIATVVINMFRAF